MWFLQFLRTFLLDILCMAFFGCAGDALKDQYVILQNLPRIGMCRGFLNKARTFAVHASRGKKGPLLLAIQCEEFWAFLNVGNR